MFRNKYLPGHWGMHGFNRHPSLRKVNISINVSEVSQISDGDEINLTELGYDKLLGKGPISRSLKITVREASPRAIAKVEAAGGSVSTESEEDGEDWGEWEEEWIHPMKRIGQFFQIERAKDPAVRTRSPSAKSVTDRVSW